MKKTKRMTNAEYRRIDKIKAESRKLYAKLDKAARVRFKNELA